MIRIQAESQFRSFLADLTFSVECCTGDPTPQHSQAACGLAPPLSAIQASSPRTTPAGHCTCTVTPPPHPRYGDERDLAREKDAHSKRVICEEAKDASASLVQSQKKAIPSSTRHNAFKFNSPLTRIKVAGIHAETHTHTHTKRRLRISIFKCWRWRSRRRRSSLT